MKVSYVQRVKRADGRTDLYFRKGTFRSGPLKSADNSHELKVEVDAILAQMEAATIALKPMIGTVRGAMEKYNSSSEFTGLEESTKREYQYKIDELIAVCGAVPLKDVTYPWLKDLQDVWALRGHKACNDLMQVLKNGLKPEMKKGSVVGRPLGDIEKLQPPTNRPEPHPAWDDSEVEAAINMATAIGQPGLARGIGLGRWGGFRRGGICDVPLNARTMGFDDDQIAQHRLYWITPKRGVLCDKPEDSRLTALLDRTPNRALTIAYNKYGQPWKPRAFNQALDRLLERLSKENAARSFLDVHGLRHARGMELAYAGASEFEIMAQLEHTTAYTARIYIRQANRAKGANSAQSKIDTIVRVRAERARK